MVTREEHETRAMLMGMLYDKEEHIYYAGYPDFKVLDADNLCCLKTQALAKEVMVADLLTDRRVLVHHKTIGCRDDHFKKRHEPWIE